MNSVCNQISNAKGKRSAVGNELPLRSRRARLATGNLSARRRSTSANNCSPQVDGASELPTKVTARIDVGFGNQLFIRGEGNGLSWDKGQLMTCLDRATWVWSAETGDEPSAYKLLLNDQLWSQGENLRVAAGAQIEVTPNF